MNPDPYDKLLNDVARLFASATPEEMDATIMNLISGAIALMSAESLRELREEIRAEFPGVQIADRAILLIDGQLALREIRASQ